MPGYSVLTSGAGTHVTGSLDTTGATLLVVWTVSTSGTLSDSKSNSWTPLVAEAESSMVGRWWMCATPTVGTGRS